MKKRGLEAHVRFIVRRDKGELQKREERSAATGPKAKTGKRGG